jgi:hypothetical protein
MKSKNKCIVAYLLFANYYFFAMNISLPSEASKEELKKKILRFDDSQAKRVMGLWSSDDSSIASDGRRRRNNRNILSYPFSCEKQENDNQLTFAVQDAEVSVLVRTCGNLRYFWTVPSKQNQRQACKITTPTITTIVMIIGTFKKDTVDIYLGFTDTSQSSQEKDTVGNPIYQARIVTMIPHFNCIEQHITDSCSGPRIGLMTYEQKLNSSDILLEIQKFLPKLTMLDLDDYQVVGALQALLGGEYPYFDKETKHLKIPE